MADEFSKKILLSIELENSQLTKVAVESQKAILNLTKEKQKLTAAYKDGTLSQDAYAKSLVKVNGQIALQKESLNTANKALNSNSKLTKELQTSQEDLTGSYKEQSNMLTLLKDKYKRLTDEEKANEKVGGELLQKINELDEGLKEADSTMGVFVRNVGNYPNTLVGIQEEIKRLTEASQSMDLNSEEFKETTEQISRLKLEADQALGKVNEFGEKEPKNPVKKAYEDAFESATALTSSIGLLTVAFGKSENIQKVQEKALQAVAIAQTAANIAKSKGAIIDTFAAAKKEILIAKERIYAFVVGKSTGAMKAFRIAVAGTGVGAIIILLAELIFNFEKVSQWTNRITNGFRDWADQVSNGNKIVKGFVEVLLLVASPLITIIRLINDFEGTIASLQQKIMGVWDELKNLTNGIPVVGDVIGFLSKQVQGLFNSFNSLATSLGLMGNKTKKGVEDIEAMIRVYERFSSETERRKQLMDDEIKLAQAQGKSQQHLADLYRKSLQQIAKDKETQYKMAVDLAKKQGKLNEKEQELFDKVQREQEESQLNLAVFEAEQLQERNEKYKEFTQERLDLERDLTAKLNALKISQVKDDIERERAALQEQRRVDQENNDLQIKEAIRKYGDKSKEVQQLREIETEQTKIFNDKMWELELEQLNRETDLVIEQIELTENKAAKQFEANSFALAKQYELDKQFLDKVLINDEVGAKKREQKQKEINAQKLELSMKYYQDQLALARKFAEEDGILTDEELNKLAAISDTINNISGQIDEIKSGNVSIADMIGLDEESISHIEFGAQQVISVLNTINDVVNSNAQNRIRALDDAFKIEQANIENSTLSQIQKEQKIQELTEKFAQQKYEVELEQFRANKAIQIVQATIGGALAVIQSLANNTIPFPGSLVAPLIIGATTAAQIGIIAGQPEPPPPQFAEGGFNRVSDDPQGFTTGPTLYRKSASGRPFIAGEAGREWIAPDWMLNKYPNLFSDLDSMRVRGFAMGGFTGGSITNINSQDIDLTQLGVIIAQEMSKAKIFVQPSTIERLGSDVSTVQANTTA